MKNSKIIAGICIVAALVVAAIAGILLLNKSESDTSSPDTDSNQQVDAKCTIVEAMQKIQPNSTQAEITEIVGFEPTVDAMIGSDPIWKFDSKNWISHKTYGDGDITIQATIDKDDLKDDNISLPSASELKEMLNNGSFTYKELVEKVGGEGTLTSISDGSVIYTWVDKHDQRLSATFNNKTGKCTIASYR